MKIVQQEVQQMEQVPSTYIETIRHIEEMGRICYQSGEKITDDSAEKFCKMLFDRKHHAMIEHSWIVLKYSDVRMDGRILLEQIYDSPFVTVYHDNMQISYVTGNWRAFIECLGKQDDWEFFQHMPENLESTPGLEMLDFEVLYDEEIPLHLRAYSVVFKTDRAVTHEMVRHRPAAFAQESQRYCAYKEEVEFILPYFYDVEDSEKDEAYDFWITHLNLVEQSYKHLMAKYKEKPQEARSILPNCTATQIVLTADLPEWKHIFNLRTSAAAYPQIKRLMIEVEEYFLREGWIKERAHKRSV